MPTPSLGSLISQSGTSRRTVLRAVGLGAVGIAASPLLAACTGSSSDSSSDSGTVTFGSNASDEVPKKAMAALMASAKKAEDLTVTINTVPHNDFQNNINNYLKGSPDDVFTWFAGYRMKSYAKQGLAADIDDVWESFGSDFSDAFQAASTGDDGKKYFVPLYNYPWGVCYRPSVFQAKGYTEPKTLDEFVALCKKMQTDGLVPIAFGDKDGWPAFGTFDYLNMRLNGYQFHVDLMAHQTSWDSTEVREVFTTWKSLLPYHAPGSLGRTWEEAARQVVTKKAGMYVFGSFVGQQWPSGDADIDFFAFPEINSAHGQDAIEAPIDGFMLSTKGGANENARQLQGGFSNYFLNSAYITIPAVVITLVLASMVAFAVSRFRWRFNVTLLIVFTAGNLLPQQILAAPLFQLYKHLELPYSVSDSGSLLNTYYGVIAANVAFQVGFCTFVLSNYLKALPGELTEAAMVDGAGVWKQYRSIILPLCRPALAALATLEFIWVYNDFFWALLFIQTGDRLPITTGINNLFGQYAQNDNLIAAGAIMTAIPALVIYLALQRQFVAGLTLGSSTG